MFPHLYFIFSRMRVEVSELLIRLTSGLRLYRCIQLLMTRSSNMHKGPLVFPERCYCQEHLRQPLPLLNHPSDKSYGIPIFLVFIHRDTALPRRISPLECTALCDRHIHRHSRVRATHQAHQNHQKLPGSVTIIRRLASRRGRCGQYPLAP